MGTVAKLAAGGATHLIASTAYATCTTAAGTKAKVATIQDSQAFTLIVGTTIHVYFQYTNTASAPTLNVNSTGALPVYKYGTTAVGTNDNTSWSAGAVVSFTYNKNNLSTGCWVMNDHIDNTDIDVRARYVHYYNNVKAKTAWTAEKIIVGDASGYSVASSGVTFNISYPILWTVVAVSAGSDNYDAIFSQIYDRNLTNIKSGFTSTANSGIYLVVTISEVIATVDSTLITDTLPTSEDGKVYIRLGKLGNNSNGSNYFIFESEHPMFWYHHGAVVPYAIIDTAGVELTQAEYDALPNSKLTDDVNYFITDKNNPNAVTASQVMYDNSESGLDSTNVQNAIDELSAMSIQTDGSITVNSTYIGSVERNGWIKVGRLVMFWMTAAVKTTWTHTCQIGSGLPAPAHNVRVIGQIPNSGIPLRLEITSNGTLNNAYSNTPPTTNQAIEFSGCYISDK